MMIKLDETTLYQPLVIASVFGAVILLVCFANAIWRCLSFTTKFLFLLTSVVAAGLVVSGVFFVHNKHGHILSVYYNTLTTGPGFIDAKDVARHIVAYPELKKTAVATGLLATLAGLGSIFAGFPFPTKLASLLAWIGTAYVFSITLPFFLYEFQMRNERTDSVKDAFPTLLGIICAALGAGSLMRKFVVVIVVLVASVYLFQVAKTYM